MMYFWRSQRNNAVWEKKVDSLCSPMPIPACLWSAMLRVEEQMNSPARVLRWDQLVL